MLILKRTKSEYDVVFKSDKKWSYTTTGSCISSVGLKRKARQAAGISGEPESKQRPYINGKFIIDEDYRKGDVYDVEEKKKLVTKASVKKIRKKK